MLKWTDFDNASVVDQDVDLTKAIDDLPNSRLNLSGIEQVALHGQDRTTAPGKISFCAPEFIAIARDERDFSACSANLPRKHEAKSA